LDTALSSLLVNNPENISHIHQICELMIKFKHAQTTSDTAVNKNTILAKINDIIATNQLGIEIKDLYITMHNRSTFFRRAMPNSMFIFFKMVRFGYQNSQLDNKQQAFATKYYVAIVN
jgi:hypothetical protein